MLISWSRLTKPHDLANADGWWKCYNISSTNNPFANPKISTFVRELFTSKRNEIFYCSRFANMSCNKLKSDLCSCCSHCCNRSSPGPFLSLLENTANALGWNEILASIVSLLLFWGIFRRQQWAKSSVEFESPNRFHSKLFFFWVKCWRKSRKSAFCDVIVEHYVTSEQRKSWWWWCLMDFGWDLTVHNFFEHGNFQLRHWFNWIPSWRVRWASRGKLLWPIVSELIACGNSMESIDHRLPSFVGH